MFHLIFLFFIILASLKYIGGVKGLSIEIMNSTYFSFRCLQMYNYTGVNIKHACTCRQAISIQLNLIGDWCQ